MDMTTLQTAAAPKQVGNTFFDFLFDFNLESTETAVLCPFPHYTEDGIEFYEERPSMHVNTEKLLYHCKSCGSQGNELSMIEQILGVRRREAQKLWALFRRAEYLDIWARSYKLHTGTKRFFERLGVDVKLLRELKIKSSHNGQRHIFPVTLFDAVMDTRIYRPNPVDDQPKMKSRVGSMTGLVWPFDRWRTTDKNKWTLLCAGEKDTLVALSRGFNAITVIGGEMTVPKILREFTGRKIAICYDNDAAGIKGSVNVARVLLPIAKEVRIIDISKTCKEKGEDITDFFVKYNKKPDHLKKLIIAAPVATTEYLDEIDPELIAQFTSTRIPLVTLEEASSPNYTDVMVRSKVMVVGVADSTWSCPSAASIIDTTTGTYYEWELKPDRPDRILELMDSNLPMNKIRMSLCKYAGVPMANYESAQVEITHRRTIYQATFTDVRSTQDDSTVIHEYTAYTFDQKLESGKSYVATMKLTPHPAKGQKLTMIVVRSTPLDTLGDFAVDQGVITSLNKFASIHPDVEQNLEYQAEFLKGFLGYNGDNRLLTILNIGYNTPLVFDTSGEKNLKGCIDMAVIGETRSGKSTSAKMLQLLYKQGAVISLAGSSATIPGLIGGSSKAGSDVWVTRAGVIPQNNKGIIIFEEFGKAKEDIVANLTDIRSSGEVRITRLNGALTFPAQVRFINLTNPKTVANKSKSINSYPNGVAIMEELVSAQEDIARYDLIHIMKPAAKSLQLDWAPHPDWQSISVQDYRNRLKWVWTRKPENIIVLRDAERLIERFSNILNRKLSCHVKIFGNETFKKIYKIAIAISGLCGVKPGHNPEELVVTGEHVKAAVRILLTEYTSDEWRLDKYVQSERLFTETDQASTEKLQEIYNANPLLIMQLDTNSDTNMQVLEMATGKDKSDLNKIISIMMKLRFVKVHGNSITPSERYRKTSLLLERDKKQIESITEAALEDVTEVIDEELHLASLVDAQTIDIEEFVEAFE